MLPNAWNPHIGLGTRDRRLPAPRLTAGHEGSTLLHDGVLLTLAILSGELVCWALPIPFWAAELIVYGPPLAYLYSRFPSVRNAIDPGFTIKAILFCAIFFTYVGVTYDAWTRPSSMPLVLGVPIEQAAWGALVIPLSIAVNQRFFVSPLPARPIRHTRLAIYLLFAAGLAFAALPVLGSIFTTNSYLKIGLIIYVPIFALAARLGFSLVRELVMVGVVFAVVHFGFELIALKHGYWSFKGQYVGKVTLNSYRIPLEELCFIIVLCSPSVVALHALRFNWKGLPRPGRPS